MPALTQYAHTRRLVVVVSAAGLVLIWVSAALWLANDRRQRIDAATDQVRRLTIIAAEQTRRLFSLTDVFLESLEEIVRRGESDDVAPADDRAVAKLVATFRRQVEGGVDIAFGNSGGHGPPAGADEVGRLTVVTPVKLGSGEWILPLTRRLAGPDEKVEVISAAIHLSTLTAIYDQVRNGDGGAVALQRRDGMLLARAPQVEDGIGRRFSGLPPFGDRGANADGVEVDGVHVGPSAIDGRLRLVGFRVIEPYGLVQAVSMTMEQVLAEWWTQVWVGMAVVGVLTAMIAAATAMLLRLLGNLEDNTCQLDRRVKARTAELEHAMEARSRFLTSVSHELRTPLNAIIGFSDALKSGTFGTMRDLHAGYVGDIHASGTHLLALVNDLLDTAAADSGRLALHEEEVALDSVVAEAVGMVREQAAASGVGLDATVTPGLTLYGDRRRLLQALLNIVANAVKYNRPGGSVRVSARVDEAGKTVIAVADSGIGMNAEETRLALIPFERAHAAASAVEGTGLGLPLAAGLIARHGGTLTIDSVPGKGTTVVLRLPSARVRRVGAAAPVRSAALAD